MQMVKELLTYGENGNKKIATNVWQTFMKQILIIFGIIIIIVVTANIILSKNNKPKNIGQVSNNIIESEISSFDLNVKIPKPNSDFLELWKAEMERIGLEVEFHPNFDINNQTGFLPFKIIVTDSSFTTKYGKGEWLTGFELYISDFDKEDYFSFHEPEDLESIPENIKKIYDKAELDFYFSANPNNNTAEFRMTWYAAATLTKLYDGILEDAYSGKNYTANNVVEIAISKTKQAETELAEDKWNLTKFVEWK